MAQTFDNADAAFATTLTRGPAPRWQRKAMEASQAANLPPTAAATPKKTAAAAAPSSASTPSRGDRFIPNRNSMNLEASHFQLTSLRDAAAAAEAEAAASPSKLEYQRSMQSNLASSDSKILAFKQAAPAPTPGFQNDLKVLYSSNRAAGAGRSSSKSTRHIPQTPDRVLDAPDMRSDFYLNLIDWSCTDVIAVALNDMVYLWNASTGSISELCQTPENEYIASVSWADNGMHLAIGCSDATVQIWDVEQQKKVRTMSGHDGRVSALCWNQHILSSGSKTGEIFNHDVRIAEHHIQTLSAHTQEVCGLKWSPDGKTLASGGNDNIVNLWSHTGEHLRALTQHQAAVKALAWCPWQPNLLATGGGTADRTIRFWNATTGACLNTIDTKSQVSSLLWNREHKEIISAHGFSQNQLTIWKYPTMTKVTELTGHEQRVLGMAMSPDGTTVVSAAGDESLRFWKCFAADPKQKKKAAKSAAAKSSIKRAAMIR